MMKKSILDMVKTFHNSATSLHSASGFKNPDRLWNEFGAQHILLLRRKAGIGAEEANTLPQIRAVVLDLKGVVYLDMTGIRALKDTLTELRAFGGKDVQVRVVGLRENLVEKLNRAGAVVVKSPPPPPSGHLA